MKDMKNNREKLINEHGYDEKQVDKIIEKISNLDSKIYVVFEKWINSGKIDDIEIEGYTINSILEKRKGMTVIGAFLMLDWLKRDPKQAKLALESIIVKKI